MINRNEYINNYKREKYKRVAFELPKDKYEELRSHVDNRPEYKSINGFIKTAIDEKIKRDNSEE